GAAEPRGALFGRPMAVATGTWVGPLVAESDFALFIPFLSRQATRSQTSPAISPLVAIVSDGTQVVAYVCQDGVLGTWFFATVGTESRLVLAGAGGALLDVMLGDVAEGEFTKDGRSYHFAAHRTDAPALFRADAAQDATAVVGGWIVD